MSLKNYHVTFEYDYSPYSCFFFAVIHYHQVPMNIIITLTSCHGDGHNIIHSLVLARTPLDCVVWVKWVSFLSINPQEALYFCVLGL